MATHSRCRTSRRFASRRTTMGACGSAPVASRVGEGAHVTNYATGSGAAPTRSPPATTARSGSEQAYAPQGADTLDSYWNGVANGALHCGPRNI